MMSKRIMKRLSLLLVLATMLSYSVFAYDTANYAENADTSTGSEDVEIESSSVVYYSITASSGAYMLKGAGISYARVRSAAFPCGLSVIHHRTQKGNDGNYWIYCTTVPNSAYGETTAYTGWIRKDLLTYSGSVWTSIDDGAVS